ncbi:unnamed protein product [Rotaria sordida]|uniref:Xaa-Pro dipeptidyl-peptidase C-terminal domain-containing protein n=1 Tax=Rotaria sordida TaxID=392033 RepID=A0A814MU11_9BILA|nr:unnamed protein product [Rotaria sordida]CAF3904936.1 unnamed protein product [Rotaria sordida]
MQSSCEKEFHRIIRTEFPYKVEKLTQVSIPVDHDIKLAATIWMPQNNNIQSVDEEKFATILEYIPYRKSDWTSRRDEIRLKYFSGFGYVSIRVDIRGTGNSQGIFDDEYSEQELSDGLKILEWIQNQKWSNGKVVIYGKSWAGFNGLQIGYLQPKNLSGIISAYSTDDRYNNDIHYYGGCLIAQEALSWSTQMLLWLSIPPHPLYQGGIDKDSNLFNIWKERLNELIPLDAYWIKHQNRDEYWRHGSICEDYSKILCPVLLIGGFADLYNSSIFRLMNQLKYEKRAILGPWGHQWPDDAYPGPQIGFLQEVIQWLDYHIKHIDNGYEKKEFLSIFKLNPNIDELHSFVKQRKGQWIHLNSLPSYPNEHFQRNHLSINQYQQINEKQIIYYLSFGSLTIESVSKDQIPDKISFLSPLETGLSSGNLLGWGGVENIDNSIDQREDDGRSLCFDSLPLNHNYELFGFPSVKLNLSSNTNYGLICVRLCMIDEKSSSSILISRGILNLTHHKSHEHPEQLNIDEIYNVEITLSGVCVCLPAGCRLRLALSTSYWPIVWPSPQLSTLTVHFNHLSPCILILPCLNDKYLTRDDFAFPEISQGIPIKYLRDSSVTRFRILDELNEIITLKIYADNGSIEYPDGLIWDETSESIYKIKKNDPQSAKIEIKRYLKYYFQDQSLIKVDIETKSIMFSQESSSTFNIIHQLNINNKDQLVFEKNWNLTFPRSYI